MNEKPSISVIIPCRGHAAELKGCLASLSNQTTDAGFEVIVVDSASDPAVAAAAAGHSNVRLISSKIPLNAEAARNLGLTVARGDMFAFIDADCIAAPGWLPAAHQSLSQGALIAGGPVGDILPRHPIAAADNLLQFAEVSPFRPPGPAGYLPGCNFGLTREALDMAGGKLDDSRPIGGDVLFTAAAAERWPDRVCFAPEMRVDHLGRMTLGAMWRHMYDFGYARSNSDIRLKPGYRRFGRYTLLLPAVAAKRWLYIAGLSARWHKPGLLRLIVLTPFVAWGLAAGALGFRDGCRASSAANGDRRKALDSPAVNDMP